MSDFCKGIFFNSQNICYETRMFLLVVCFMTSFITVFSQDDSLEKIVLGRDAKPGEFPYAANILLRRNLTQVCGGSIVSKLFIMTACHCVGVYKNESFENVEVSSILITAGHLERKPRSLYVPREYQAARYADMSIIHPECCEDPETGDYIFDIGFFRITYPFQWTSRIQPLPILQPKKNETAKIYYETFTKKLINSNAKCTSYGWGLVDEDEDEEYVKPASHLKTINLRLLKFTECDRVVESDGNVCAKSLEKGGDVCKGDTGTALLCDGYALGIVSKNPSCGSSNFSSIFTRMDFVYDFYAMFLNE